MERNFTDVAVIGAGPAGLTAALALASSGVSVTLVGSPRSDNRTTALLASSVTALETLDVWDGCRENAAPLALMRIVDDTGRLWRAPEIKFSACEIGLDTFGWNIENRFLVEALSLRIGGTPNITHVAQPARSVVIDDEFVTVLPEDGAEIRARLVIGADGRNSLCRTAAGIEATSRNYAQTALAVNFSHDRPHHNTSTEFHTATGPFTLVPLPGARSSLVCVVNPDEAEALYALDDSTLNEEIERRAHSILGKVRVEPPAGNFRCGSRRQSGSPRIAPCW